MTNRVPPPSTFDETPDDILLFRHKLKELRLICALLAAAGERDASELAARLTQQCALLDIALDEGRLLPSNWKEGDEVHHVTQYNPVAPYEEIRAAIQALLIGKAVPETTESVCGT